MRAYIEITNICNLTCSFCPKTIRENQFMSTENFEKIIINIKKKTSEIYLHIMGEPLLHPKIFEILTICDKYNMSVDLTTNGTLLKDEILDFNCIHKISISLHSQEQNDIFSKEYIINCINFAKIRKNVIIEFRLWNNNDNIYNSDILSLLAEYFPHINIVNETNKLEKGLYLSVHNTFAWPHIKGAPLRDFGYCLGLRRQFGVLVDGTVVPCCLDSDGNIPLGNALIQDINFILNSTRAKNLYHSFVNKKPLTEELCRRCGYSISQFG